MHVGTFRMGGFPCDLKQLREQIDEALQKPKATVRVWNPRSMKHDIIEQ